MESAIQPGCLQCEECSDRWFCDLPPQALKSFDKLKSTIYRPQGTVLFGEGSQPQEIVVLCNGRARLSVGSEDEGRLTVRIAAPGEVLGLSACLLGSPHEVTAELLDSSQVAVVNRAGLLQFLHDHQAACIRIIGLLSRDLHLAYDRVRSVDREKSRQPRAPRIH
jgi:CRP/FNR family cyclic AMP-dependent transcriptional regulator